MNQSFPNQFSLSSKEDAAALRASFFEALRLTHPVKIGVRIAVITTAAAVWAVADYTYGSNDGSAIATDAGVATAFPPTVPIAIPIGSGFRRIAL